jgi:hypothetical protein
MHTLNFCLIYGFLKLLHLNIKSALVFEFFSIQFKNFHYENRTNFIGRYAGYII